MLCLGFSAGLPILLVFGTLGNWLNEAGMSKSTITYFSWAGLGYGFKFIWAPLIDQARLPILTPLLGKRRSWLLLCQLLLLLILAGMALTDPIGSPDGLLIMALLAVALGFTSASQDIVIDAYRIEITPPRFLGLSSSSYILGYRLGMIIASTFALILSEKLGSTLKHYSYPAWQTTYFVMAGFMLIGIITTLVIAEPDKEKPALDSSGSGQLILLFFTLIIPFILLYIGWQPLLTELLGLPETTAELGPLGGFIYKTLRLITAFFVCFLVAKLVIAAQLVKPKIAADAYWTPIAEFSQRYPLKVVLLILLLIGFYRISDMVLGVIANVFYQDIGFSKEQIGYISKFFGLTMTIFGSFLGGLLIVRFGTMKMMMLGAVFAALTNLLFILLANTGQVEWLLYIVICADNLAAGIANIAFVTFLSRLSNIQFTAMQYAIFSSLMALIPRLIGGYSGSIVDASDYSTFFLITTLMGLPVILLVWLVDKRLTLSEDNG
ncbi:MAG: MFS transporter [Gammaproteobacteria bacterium]|nr:MAG: MFS transporter [Gammaproteobacteria bacterium]